jgi:hypothetical protein
LNPPLLKDHLWDSSKTGEKFVNGPNPVTPDPKHVQLTSHHSKVEKIQKIQLSGINCVLNLVPVMTPKYPKIR